MTARWRNLLKTIRSSVQNAEHYVLACMALHNYLRQTNTAHYCPNGFIESEDGSGTIRPGDWRSMVNNGSTCFVPINLLRGRRNPGEATEMRDALA